LKENTQNSRLELDGGGAGSFRLMFVAYIKLGISSAWNCATNQPSAAQHREY
jgi:hypothetical protein